MLRSYGLTEVTGDRYAAEWVVSAFATCGITYRHSERDRSAIYQDALPLFTSGRVRLLDNQKLVSQFASLEDAGNYITKLPKAEHMAAEWQAAMESLILVAKLGGPTMFARIGVMRALNRHVERVIDPSRKDEHHWGRRKLARDR